jgi:hypothetical protein
MARKQKLDRSMAPQAEAQRKIEEKHAAKFQEDWSSSKRKLSQGRNFPLVGFTISPEDKETLDELTLYLSNKNGRVATKSALQRELIRLGKKYKEEIGSE